jgi:hypothetical protein
MTGNCGTTLYSLCEALPGVHFVKAGTLDDIKGLDESKPQVELFTSRRVSWVPVITGAQQALAMT